MSAWWLADAQGRVLGPVGPEVVQELWSTQAIAANTRVSSDGKRWVPITSVPELLGASESSAERDARQRQEAAQLRARLEMLRRRPVHEIFGVRKESPLEEYREAFFRISKRFHPDRLPNPILPELREASVAVFRFLSGSLTRFENDLKRAPAAPSAAPPPPPPAGRHIPLPRRPVQSARAAPAAPPPPVSAAPVEAPEEDRYGPERFVGLEPGPNGEFQASIQVSPRTVSMFYEHPLVNLRQGGLFLSGSRVLPLGTRLMVTLDFDDPPRTLVVRGYVTFECAQGRGPMGFGVILSGMGREERAFVEDYVARNRNKGARIPARA